MLKDVDGDGRTELAVFYRDKGPPRGGSGEIAYRELNVFDFGTTGKPVLQLHLVLDHRQAPGITGQYQTKIRYRTRIVGKKKLRDIQLTITENDELDLKKAGKPTSRKVHKIRTISYRS